VTELGRGGSLEKTSDERNGKIEGKQKVDVDGMAHQNQKQLEETPRIDDN
jgi:hypothetical protein